MALVGRDEFDAAVAVPVVVPVDKSRYPLARLRFAGKRPIGVVGPVFDRSEQGFRVGVVVADARPRERSQHSQFLQPALQRGRSHGIAVIGMEDQWRLVALLTAKAAGAAVALLEAGPLHQISRDLRRLHLSHIPGHHLSAPDIDHQVEVQPHTPHRGRQIGEIP